MGQRGYVYVLSNPSMPGVVKIGRSRHGGFARAKSIYSGATGVPQPFHLEFEVLVDDAESVEISVHEQLEKFRVNSDREFFRCSVSVAVENVLNKYIEQFDLVAITQDEYMAVVGAGIIANEINEHYIDVCHSVGHIDAEEVKKAVLHRRMILEEFNKKKASG